MEVKTQPFAEAHAAYPYLVNLDMNALAGKLDARLIRDCPLAPDTALSPSPAGGGGVGERVAAHQPY
jgi:hypothetical protein